MRLTPRTWLPLAVLAATWPVWRWYVLRMTDGSDEPWGVLALVTLAVIAWRDRHAVGTPRLVWPGICLAIYAITYPIAPPLGRAMLAASAMGAMLFTRAGAAPRWGLLALSLPIVATLQFYLGYPLRVLAASVSVLTLHLCGAAVMREGTLLQWRGETVMVDVPCSGIHMLWVGLYFACVLAAWHRLNALRTLWCAAAAVLVVVAANAVRATILFFKEAHMVFWPHWTHTVVGVALFGLAAWAIAGCAQSVQARPGERE